jgi:hypothetical protein
MKLTYLIVISSIILISACTESLPGEEPVGKVENSEHELPGDELVIVNTELVDQIRFPLTMMIGEICEDEDLLIQEGEFTTALELTIHYQIQDDQLKLFLATGEELLFASTD